MKNLSTFTTIFQMLYSLRLTKNLFCLWGILFPQSFIISVTEAEAGRELYLILSLPTWQHRAMDGLLLYEQPPKFITRLAGSPTLAN